MSIDPHVKIDGDYTDQVNAALAAHDAAVEGPNRDLADGTLSLDEFEVVTAAARADYHAALEAANNGRTDAKEAAAPAYAAHLAEAEQAAAADTAKRAALKAKLEAGTASAAELQEAVALTIDGDQPSP